jgi:succinate-semialdehyde dehydrogenase/glutarate-semialdehyde dehydrogenase
MTLEQGKPLEQARAEVLATADQFDWNADEARRVYGRIVSSKTGSDQIFVYPEPIGPVATFAPWNFPSLLPGRKISAALAAGCAVLVVPAIEAPLSALLIARAALEAGIPPGALTIVLGDPALLSETIISDSRIRKVSVTSSVPVGQIVMGIAAKTITPVTLELGGHSPVIVMEGVDVAAVAALCSAGKFRNAGQVCISASRFFVAEPIYEEFVAHFVAHTKNLKIGPGTDPASDVGPLSTSRRLAAIDDMVADARKSGAEIAFGGKKVSSFSDGYFYEPTVVLQPDDSTVVMREETFGPIAPISSYSSLDEAVGRANSTPYGLAGFIFSEDIGDSLTLARRLEVGMVGINNLTIATAEAPFGGVKMSGFGREGGLEGVSDYTVTKYVNVRQPARSDNGK